ncbi:sensor histidine kinase [Endothiovibrio diazotrophicus]
MAVELLRRLTSGPRPVVLLVLLLLASLSLMSDATRGSAHFSALFSLLMVVNVLGLLILLALIGRHFARLVRQYRAREPGSRLTARLVLTFVLLAVLPLTVVYSFSLQFLHRGIDSWFDVRIEQALEDALALGRGALDAPLREALNRCQGMADRLASVNNNLAALTLDEMRHTSGAQELTLMRSNGQAIASSSADPLSIVPDLPGEGVMIQLRQSGSYVGLEAAPNRGLLARVVVRVSGAGVGSEDRLLQGLFPVSERDNTLATNVEQAYGQYKELSYLRKPLKYSFTLTLSLVVLLSLLAAVWAAFFSARRLAKPVRDLAEGTRAVAGGDYDTRLPPAGNDELGVLVDSFNWMTRRLAQARDEASESQRQLAAQHAYLGTVLGRLSSGVMTLTDDLRLHTANAAAHQVLGLELSSRIGAPLAALAGEFGHIEPFCETLARRFSSDPGDWSEMVTLFGGGGRQALMLRGTRLADAPGGFVVVFDDLTALIQAQRNAAWGEVARRLAHEIRNPLTPIQLSAERLRHKLAGTLGPKEGAILERSTHTIVQQVEAMKEMVNAFSDYARAPQMELEPLDLNELITEVLELYRGTTRLELRLTDGLPPVEGDAGRLRQLLHNLVKNGQEAMEGVTRPLLTVTTRAIDEATCRGIELAVEDRGPGFPEALFDQLFEPYVTTKPKGSGLGLAIVKKIVEELGGMIRAENLVGGGARIIIRLPVPSGGAVAEE